MCGEFIYANYTLHGDNDIKLIELVRDVLSSYVTMKPNEALDHLYNIATLLTFKGMV